MLILNKIDTVPAESLLAVAAKLNEGALFGDTFMISALKGHGVPKLVARLGELMVPGPWLYPEDQVSDAPLRSLAAEITREKLFERLHDELPYQSTVETELWKEQPDGSARVEQTIYVTRDGHKKIVIGEGGRTIKAIGSAARKGDHRGGRAQHPPLPVREGAPRLGRRPGTLSHDGARFFEVATKRGPTRGMRRGLVAATRSTLSGGRDCCLLRAPPDPPRRWPRRGTSLRRKRWAWRRDGRLDLARAAGALEGDDVVVVIGDLADLGPVVHIHDVETFRLF